MMRVKLFNIILLIVFMSLLTTFVYAEETKVDVKITLVADEDNYTVINNQFDLGSYVSFTGLDSDYEFSFYIINGVVRKDLSVNATILASADLDIMVVYKKIDGKNPVLFMDTNGHLIDQVKYVVNNDSVNIPNDIDWDSYTKPNYNLVKEDDLPVFNSLAGSKTLNNITEPSVFSLTYELKDDLDKITINEAQYNFNDVVHFNSDNPEFIAWVDADNNVLSFSSKYSFTALFNQEIKEADLYIEERPLITLNDVEGLREGYKSYLGSYYLPSGYELIEVGIKLDGNYIKSNSVNLITNEFLRSIPNNITGEVKSYLTYKHENTVTTIYNGLKLDTHGFIGLGGEVSLTKEGLNFKVTESAHEGYGNKLENRINFLKDYAYELKLTLKSSRALNDVAFLLDQNDGGFYPLSGIWGITLDNNYKELTLQFIATKDFNNTNLLLEVGGQGEGEYDVIISKLEIIKYETTKVEFLDKRDDGGVAEFNRVENDYSLEITEPADEGWKQGIATFGYQFDNDTTYLFSYNIKSLQEMNYKLLFEDNVINDPLGHESNLLVEVSKSYTHLFKTTGEAKVNIIFELNGPKVVNTVEITNVLLSKLNNQVSIETKYFN